MNKTNEQEQKMPNRLLPRVVLIACGSYSPPTPMHLRMFEIARDYFEMQGTHAVIGGIISPTNDSYSKKGLAPAEHRCTMLKIALRTSSWIRLSDWEVNQSQWTRTRLVLQYHQNYMNNYINSQDLGNEPGWLPANLREQSDAVQLKLLCGADLLESFAVPGLWADEDIEHIVGFHGLVVISRSGTNPERFIFDSDLLTKYCRNIHLVTNWIPNEVSSTMVRRLIQRGGSVKYLLDDHVIEYIKTHGLFRYNFEYMTAGRNPLQKFDTVERLNEVNKNKNRNAENGERMDETDYTVGNIMNTGNRLDNHKSKVFCCGEIVPAKLLLNRSSPGQAVQVTGTNKGTKTVMLMPQQEAGKIKKIKITSAENV